MTIALEHQIQNTKLDLEDNSQHNFESDKKALELYVFLWHWTFQVAEVRSKSKNTSETKMVFEFNIDKGKEKRAG